jgi:DNA-binding NtrC family response regulator
LRIADHSIDWIQVIDAIRGGAVEKFCEDADDQELLDNHSTKKFSETDSSYHAPQPSFPKTFGQTAPKCADVNGQSKYRIAQQRAGRNDCAFENSRSLKSVNLALNCRNTERLEQVKALIQGDSAALRSVRQLIVDVADTCATVMIYGESGTGKELVANAIHRLSKRAAGPFVPVNMSAIPQGLAESMLFGHEKGAFTNAVDRHLGWCALADGGTLFLDEIGEMELAIQPKLLRFLQEGSIQRVGSGKQTRVDVRLITATNRDPSVVVEEGRMREDLFFRLHVVPIYLPPLRQRPEDIAPLAELFVHRAALRHGRSVQGFTKAALDILTQFNWPGNVRQLENAIERLVIFSRHTIIEPMDIPAEFHSPAPISRCVPRFSDADLDLHPQSDGLGLTAIQRTERTAIIDALQRTGGHVVDAARLLGLGQATMYRKIKQYAVPNRRKRRRVAPR